MLTIKNQNSFVPLLKVFAIVFSLIFSLPSFANSTATYKLEIKGIKNTAILDNAKIYTKMIVPAEMDGSERNKILVKRAIERAVSVFGYYDTQITFQIHPSKKDQKITKIIANVKLGKPSRISGISTEFVGDAAQDPEFQLLKQQTPKIGSIVLQKSYDDYKGKISQLALERGYFDGDFTLSRLEVSPQTYQAWWKLVFNSGVRYKFGKFHFVNNQIRDDYLKNVMPMAPDEPYLMSQLSQLNSEYTRSGWFSSVLFQPKVDKQKKVVNMDIFFIPRKKNQFNVGIGYSTDVGMRYRLGWKRPWINSRGHSLGANIYVSKPKKAFGATYKMPLLKNPLKYYYDFGLGIEKEKENDTDTTAGLFSALRYWNKPTGWQYAFGVRSRYDSFTQGNQSHNTTLIYPTLSFNRTRFRGGLFPYWGDTQQIAFDYGNKHLFSDVGFFKIKATSIWIRSYLKNHRVVFRGELGYLNAKEFERIPPSLRFFAGGDRSVRGYGYKKISPTDKQGKLVGGSRLANLSLEYQYQVYPKWWLATFFDSGLAADTYHKENLHYGTGVGLRWVSPVGAIKLDVARPVNDKNTHNIQIYLGLGSDL